MSYLIAVDPGKLQCGVAIFKDALLVHGTLARNPVDTSGSDGPQVWRNTAQNVVDAYVRHTKDYSHGWVKALVLEVPQIYRTGLQKGDQRDVLALAGVDGAIAGMFDCPVSYYTPAQWKGQVPKVVMNKRIMSRLSPVELKAIDVRVPASLIHNVQDAIGIGLKYLRRL